MILKYLKKIFFFRYFQDQAYFDFQNMLGYFFKDISLLEKALSHRSYVYLQKKNLTLFSNERLEFLGDAVLDLIIVESLYLKYPFESEGLLSQKKNVLVSSKTLSIIASNCPFIEKLLKLDRIDLTGKKRENILTDCLEAIIGAIYLDGGLLPTKKFIQWSMIDKMDILLQNKATKNYKSLILEWGQCKKKRIEFKVLEEKGKDHCKLFLIGLFVNKEEYGRLWEQSKKEGEQKVARIFYDNVIEDC